jgi:predicted nucleic acid-binding protein
MADPAPAFLDTAYVFALINTRDRWHTRARQWEQTLSQQHFVQAGFRALLMDEP